MNFKQLGSALVLSTLLASTAMAQDVKKTEPVMQAKSAVAHHRAHDKHLAMHHKHHRMHHKMVKAAPTMKK